MELNGVTGDLSVSLSTSFVLNYTPESFRCVLFISTVQGESAAAGMPRRNNFSAAALDVHLLPIHQIKSSGYLQKSLWAAIWKLQYGLELSMQFQNFTFLVTSFFFWWIYLRILFWTVYAAQASTVLYSRLLKLALTPVIQHLPFHSLHSSTQL